MPVSPPTCVVCAARRVSPLSGTTCASAWLCRHCGHTFVGIVPEEPELEALYEVYSYDRPQVELPAFLRDVLGSLIDSFERHRQTGLLLDVGFGAGLLLDVARKRNWRTHGVELSRAAVERGREANLGELHLGDFTEVPLPEASFDVVVMTELIEHLPDATPFLKRAAGLLRPGGLLYLTTPHGRGVSGRLLGADWSMLKPPEHLHLFSIESVRRSLDKAGFSKARVYTQGVLPHEIAMKVRARLPVGRREDVAAERPAGALDGDGRVARSYALNATLMKTPLGRAAKRASNTLLRLSGLGDSLRAEAVR